MKKYITLVLLLSMVLTGCSSIDLNKRYAQLDNKFVEVDAKNKKKYAAFEKNGKKTMYVVNEDVYNTLKEFKTTSDTLGTSEKLVFDIIIYDNSKKNEDKIEAISLSEKRKK